MNLLAATKNWSISKKTTEELTKEIGDLKAINKKRDTETQHFWQMEGKLDAIIDKDKIRDKTM